MPQVQTPTWTDAISILSDQVLARGSVLRGTIDLRAKYGARIFAAVGRGGTTALSGGTYPGVSILVRPLWNNGSLSHPGVVAAQLSQIAAAASTTVNADSNSGQAVVNVASATGIVADDLVCIQDSGGGVTRLEWQRVSKISGATLVLDRNLIYTHTSAQADTVRNKADAWTFMIDGGALYEVIVDYGDDTAGESVTVRLQAQTFASNLIT